MAEPRDPGAWWDFDPAERPVPLTPDAEAVIGEAHQTVTTAQEAIAREVTEPLLTPPTFTSDGDVLETSRRPLALALCLLLVGCLAMFSIGWKQGAAPRGFVDPQAQVRADHHPDLLKDVTRGTTSDPAPRFSDGFSFSNQIRTNY